MFPVGLILASIVFPTFVKAEVSPFIMCHRLTDYAIYSNDPLPNYDFFCTRSLPLEDRTNCKKMVQGYPHLLDKIREFANRSVDKNAVSEFVTNHFCVAADNYTTAFTNYQSGNPFADYESGNLTTCSYIQSVFCGIKLAAALMACGGPEDLPCILAAIAAVFPSCLPCVCAILGCPSECTC